MGIKENIHAADIGLLGRVGELKLKQAKCDHQIEVFNKINFDKKFCFCCLS